MSPLRTLKIKCAILGKKGRNVANRLV